MNVSIEGSNPSFSVMSPSTPQAGLPQRTVRGGAHMVVHVGRRTVSFTQQPGASPLQRVAALVLLVPLLVLVVALGAVLLAVLVFVALIVALVLSVAALFFGQRVQRGR